VTPSHSSSNPDEGRPSDAVTLRWGRVEVVVRGLYSAGLAVTMAITGGWFLPTLRDGVREFRDAGALVAADARTARERAAGAEDAARAAAASASQVERSIPEITGALQRIEGRLRDGCPAQPRYRSAP
jgi:hypothetical protein